MRIGLFVDLEGQRTWHRWLSDDLSRLGHEFAILRPLPDRMIRCPAGMKLALWLDPIWYRLQGEHAFEGLSGEIVQERGSFGAAASKAFDVIIDASGSGLPLPQSGRVMRILFNGVASELAAAGAVLDDGPIVFSIDEGAQGGLEEARPGIARRACLTEALDSLFSSVVELLVDRIDKTPAGRTISAERGLAAPGGAAQSRGSLPGTPAGARHVGKIVAARIARYLGARTKDVRRWAIATRACAGPGLVGGAWPAIASYTTVPDDGRRYYADPFLFESSGRLWLFAEEFPYATGRGIISVAEAEQSGGVGAFRPVLERPYHLSYPFVFACRGEIWMMPEASASGAVELYRAVEFPHRWELDRVLLEGVPGCDATILPFSGRYWMVLTSTRWRGSTWDKQRLYEAGSPLGPWSEHAGGLVRVDCGTARPAGAGLVRGGRILRPVQNSSRLYGGSMALLQVEDLSATACREKAVADIRAASPSTIVGAHTYSIRGGVEAVDVWGEVSAVQSIELHCSPVRESEATAVPQAPGELASKDQLIVLDGD